MTHTDKLTVVTQALKTKFDPLVDDTLFHDPPIKATFYGDQTKLPVVPAVCFEPGTKTRTLTAAQYFTENTFEVHILIFFTQIGTMSEEVIRKTVDELAEAIEAEVHKDPQLLNGGASPADEKVIHGFVREHESGYTYRGTTMYRSAHLTYEARSKTQLR